MSRRSAIVTGSTSGIGLGIAEAFARSGMNVMINGFGEVEAIEAERERLQGLGGSKVIYSPADMSKPAEIREMVALAQTEFGTIDIVINNAGIQHVSPIEAFPEDKWDAIIAINLSSAFHMIKATAGGMKKAGWGRIINIASAHALVASPFKSAYVAAKHGIAGLTKTIALEMAQSGVTANAICPGYVLTPLVSKQIPDTAQARGITEEEVVRDVLLAAQPTKRFVTVEEISALALFLCSDSAASMTGAILSMDGGWTAA